MPTQPKGGETCARDLLHGLHPVPTGSQVRFSPLEPDGGVLSGYPRFLTFDGFRCIMEFCRYCADCFSQDREISMQPGIWTSYLFDLSPEEMVVTFAEKGWPLRNWPITVTDRFPFSGTAASRSSSWNMTKTVLVVPSSS